jgi:hypothetical protein
MTAFADREFIETVRKINDFCLDYGCLFEVGGLRGADVASLKAYVTDPRRAGEGADLIYNAVNDWFTVLGYHPFRRAHFIYRAQRTPYFLEFSHHLERGLLLYYKGDFFSAVQVMQTAVEGILRLYVGGGPGDIGKRLVSMMRTTSHTAVHAHLAGRHALFKEILERFLRRWFFARTTEPHLGNIPSKLNRNFMSHLFDSGSFYRPADCNRLFAAFDVMLEVVTLEHIEVEHFISMPREGIPEVEARERYYTEILLSWSDWRKLRDFEEQFMSENPRYESSPVPEWAGLLAARQGQIASFIADIIAGRSPVINADPPSPLRPGHEDDEGDGRTT